MRRRSIAALGVATLASLSVTAVAEAKVRHVHPGQSIQRAVNRAAPGDVVKVHPGVYRQNVTIAKHGITLWGVRENGRMPVLRPGRNPTPSICSQAGFVSGICVIGTAAPVRDTLVRGFVVTRFSGFGVFLLNTAHTRVAHVRATYNGGYGISGFELAHVNFSHNVAAFNGEPGFYVGDSPRAHAVLEGNRAFGDQSNGFFLRDSSIGVLKDNSATGNCVGVLMLDTGSPGPVSDWILKGNDFSRNNAACGGGGDEPPLSGIGVALVGTHHVIVKENVINGNRPSGPSVLSGGMVVISSAPFGGADPTNNVVRDNVIRRNLPRDIVWDGSGSGNNFLDNSCATSSPPGLCS